MLLAQHLPDDLLDRHPVPTGHRRPPFRRTLRSPTNNERRGGRNYVAKTRFRPTPSYTTLRDVTDAKGAQDALGMPGPRPARVRGGSTDTPVSTRKDKWR